jgi:hypothetical protein
MDQAVQDGDTECDVANAFLPVLVAHLAGREYGAPSRAILDHPAGFAAPRSWAL